MRGKVLFLPVVLACLCQSAWARLGESSQAIGQRYGTPISSQVLVGFTRCVYQKDAYAIFVFFQNGVSVMETFASRGLDQNTARTLVSHIAQSQIGCPGPDDESKIRQASGITARDEVFWTWTASGQSFDAAFSPVECSLAIFNQPSIYASIHQAVANVPLPGA